MKTTERAARTPSNALYVIGTESNPVQIHYVGGYVSYSTGTADRMGELNSSASPLLVKEKRQEQTGFEQKVAFIDAKPTIVETPVFRYWNEDITPSFKSLGKPLKKGDKVKVIRGKGFLNETVTLVDFSDHIVTLDTSHGRIFWKWDGVVIERA